MKLQKPFLILFFLLLSLLSNSFTVSANPLFGPHEFTARGWFPLHYSNHHFESVEKGEGLLTIEKTSANSKLHDGFIQLNGQWIRLRNFFSGNEDTLEQKIPVKKQNSLKILFWGKRGAALSVVVSQPSSQPVSITEFLVNPTTITEGESASLTWATEHAETVAITPSIGEVGISGTISITPISTTTYTLTAGNQENSLSAQTTVTVLPLPPTAKITIEPESIVAGDTATLSWETERAETVSIDKGIGTVAASGSKIITPAENTLYTLTASNAGGTVTSSITAKVIPIQIIIDSHLDQSSVATPSIQVKGRIKTTAQYVEVSVNKRHALVNSKEFLISDLPLEPGENIITVHGRDSNGNTAKAEISVTKTDTSDWIEIQLDKSGGFAPLETGLTIIPHVQSPLNWDTAILDETDGKNLLVEGSAETGYQLTFTDSGFYTLNFQVRDDSSNLYEEKIFISVLPPFTASDWQAMKDGTQQFEDSFNSLLLSNDVTTARQMVLERAESNPDFSSAALSSGALCLVFRGIIPVIVDLLDPDAPPLD